MFARQVVSSNSSMARRLVQRGAATREQRLHLEDLAVGKDARFPRLTARYG